MSTRGNFIGRGGMGSKGRIRQSKIYVLPFKDHRNNPALMVFDSTTDCPLPPLYSFSIYLTHPAASAEDIDAKALFTAIINRTPYANTRCPVRLELYFHPLEENESDFGVSTCITHYHGEKATRGDYNTQLNATEPTGGLPGLVPTYINSSNYDYYNGLIYIYPKLDWPVDDCMGRRVWFDPIPLERYAALVAEEPDEPRSLPETLVRLEAIHVSESELNAMSAPPRIGSTIFGVSLLKTENFTSEAREEAEDRGWTTW